MRKREYEVKWIFFLAAWSLVTYVNWPWTYLPGFSMWACVFVLKGVSLWEWAAVPIVFEHVPGGCFILASVHVASLQWGVCPLPGTYQPPVPSHQTHHRAAALISFLKLMAIELGIVRNLAILVPILVHRQFFQHFGGRMRHIWNAKIK